MKLHHCLKIEALQKYTISIQAKEHSFPCCWVNQPTVLIKACRLITSFKSNSNLAACCCKQCLRLFRLGKKHKITNLAPNTITN